MDGSGPSADSAVGVLSIFVRLDAFWERGMKALSQSHCHSMQFIDLGIPCWIGGGLAVSEGKLKPQ